VITDADQRLPVTLLTGFLGAGKTTLLNRMLAEAHGQELAVVVNELGDVGIDGRLVVGGDEEVVELANGCICCTIRGDLVRTLHDLLARRRGGLLRRRRAFDRVVIEASGMASPGPAIQTLLVDGVLAAAYRVDGVVCLAHAGEIVRQLVEHPEASEQLVYADVVLLNHADRVDGAALGRARAEVSACNGLARVAASTRAEVDVQALFALAPDARDLALRGPAHAGDCRVHHTSGVGTVTLRADEPLALEGLRMWLGFLARRTGHEVMRVKGIVRCADSARAIVVQGVYQWIELAPVDAAPPEESVLVVIGRGLDGEELKRGWAAARA
jgi:G3E family GTPase